MPAELRRQILAAGQQLLRVEALPCLTLGETLASLASAPLLTQPFAASLWEAVPCCGARGVLGKAGSCLSARVGSGSLLRSPACTQQACLASGGCSSLRGSGA